MKAYLDYNATTPVDPDVLDAMLPYLAGEFANASSIHTPGQKARTAVELAREAVAALIGASPAEVVFTSGGTEADNLAILGCVAAVEREKKHVITTSVEHHAVLNACQELERQGAAVTYVPVDRRGVLDPDEIRRALRPETILISVMHANNELGTIQPVAAAGEIARQSGVLFHCDAVQTAGKLPLDVNAMHADFLSLSAHKMYGPKGAGALFIRAGTPLARRFFGGHHERDRRPGTENVPGIVGLGRAAQLALGRLAEDGARIGAWRDTFETKLMERVPGTMVNGAGAPRVPNTANISFSGTEGESLVIALDLKGLACSTGAACSSGAVEPSHVLTAIGLSAEEARSSVRFSLGRPTLAEEVDYALEMIPAVVGWLRSLAPPERRAVGVR